MDFYDINIVDTKIHWHWTQWFPFKLHTFNAFVAVFKVTFAKFTYQFCYLQYHCNLMNKNLFSLHDKNLSATDKESNSWSTLSVHKSWIRQKTSRCYNKSETDMIINTLVWGLWKIICILLLFISAKRWHSRGLNYNLGW